MLTSQGKKNTIYAFKYRNKHKTLFPEEPDFALNMLYTYQKQFSFAIQKRCYYFSSYITHDRRSDAVTDLGLMVLIPTQTNSYVRPFNFCKSTVSNFTVHFQVRKKKMLMGFLSVSS